MKNIFAFLAGVALVVGGFYFNQENEGSGGGSSLWYVASSKLRPASDLWGLRIPSLTNCNTVDTDGSGIFSCGTDASGSGGISTTTPLVAGEVVYATGVSTIGSIATGTLTTTATGLSLSNTRALIGGAAILSLDSGYAIATTTRLKEHDSAYSLSHAAVTLSGTPDYITLSGQDIMRGTIDISDDTNLSADGTEIVLTGDALSLGTALTFTTGTSSTSFQTALLGVGADYISDITGTGIINTGGLLQASLGTDITAAEMANGDHGFFTYTTNVASVDAGAWTSANIASYVSDETGTGNVVFSATPNFTGTIQGSGLRLTASSTLAYASSTALTVSGNSFFTFASTSQASTTGLTVTSLYHSAFTALAGLLTGSGVWDLGNATSLEIPNGAAPTVDATGECAIDTTSDQLVCFGASAKKVYGNGNFYPSFTYSTSTAWTGTTTIPLGPAFVAETWNAVKCFTDTGTVNVDFGDGTNFTNATTSKAVSAQNPVPTHTLSSNNTFTAGEPRYARVGTAASSPTSISCTVSKSLTAD